MKKPKAICNVLKSSLMFLKNSPFILHYIIKTKSYVKERKKHDTIFVFGSGSSINDITSKEWKLFKKNGETFSFSYFTYCDKVPIDYHMFRELIAPEQNTEGIKKYYSQINNNKMFKNSAIIMCVNPFRAYNQLFFSKRKHLNNKQIIPFMTKINTEEYHLPSKSMLNITHINASLFDAVNISYLLGYKKIVLVGFDLYDSRYFYSKKEVDDEYKKQGLKKTGKHLTTNLVLKNLKPWNDYFKKKGIKLYVYNPKSLLTEILPLFKFKTK